MRALVALGALSLSTFVYVTTETLPIGLLPLIAPDLHSTASAVGLLVTAYGSVVVAASIPLTRLTRRMDRRLLLCGLLAVFVVGTATSALAGTYLTLLMARVLTALSQAVFWAVITPVAASLFRPRARPRALAVLYAGSSVAALAGVPAGTWLGQQAGWRVAFLALSAIGAAILVTVAVALPPSPPGAGDTANGSAPDAGRYRAMVVSTALAVTGAFAAFTYISPFLTQVSGFHPGAVGPLLFARGLAGLIGVLAAGLIAGRGAWLTMTGLIGVQAVALAGQWAFGTDRPIAVLSLCASGLTLAAMSAVLGVRVLEVAPGSSDMAAAGTSTAFNVGITAGALTGSVLLPTLGVRSTPLAGAAFTLGALAVALAEPRLSSRRSSSRRSSSRRSSSRRPAARSADAAGPAESADLAPASGTVAEPHRVPCADA